MQAYAILLNSEPAGLVQAYPVDSEADADACGMDLLIGDPSLNGLGLGFRVIEEFVRDEVFGRLSFSVCIADPDATNQRSIRAFEKAGFVHRRFAKTDRVVADIMARQAAHIEASGIAISSQELGSEPSSSARDNPVYQALSGRGS